MIWLLIPLSIICGTLGRAGGAKGYHTLWRDWGCSLIITLVAAGMTGLQLQFWWVYILIFLLHWGTFSTYWDWLFKGVDTFWFSGLMVGLALFPIMFIDMHFWWIVALRAVILMILWECLNKFLPQRILCWNRDVAEEFSRYFVSL
jgi:hypothetical protein